MEIRKVKCGNRIWQLVNESWSTSNAWGHRTHVIRNGYDFGEHKVRYYNRTWEMYTYQTCMFGAIETIKQNELNWYIEEYKRANDITRFKSGEKQKVIKEFEKTEIAKDLKKVYKAIKLREFD